MSFTAESTVVGAEIQSRWTFAFARAAVIDAWLNADRLARWWGPTGFRNTFEVCEIRTGGDWRFVMHGPDGSDYPNLSRFVAVKPPERILIEHLSAPHFLLSVTFHALESHATRVDFFMRFDSPELCERIAGIVVPANAQNAERLEAELRLGSPHLV